MFRYIEQDSIVDHVFPPTGKDGFDPDFEIQEFSSFGFWREDIADLQPGELKECRVLNIVIGVTPAGLEYEADQRHVDILIDSLEFQRAKGQQQV